MIVIASERARKLYGWRLGGRVAVTAWLHSRLQLYEKIVGCSKE